MFKRTLLAAVALSVFAAPMAHAQSRYDAPRFGHHKIEKQRHFAPKQQKTQRHTPPRHHWKKGERVRDWKKRPSVRDHHRYGLRKPGPGQQWVKVDNDYLLISLATGMILGLAAGR